MKDLAKPVCKKLQKSSAVKKNTLLVLPFFLDLAAFSDDKNGENNIRVDYYYFKKKLHQE